MARKVLFIIVLALLASTMVTAQQVTFGSAQFERGVKQHLGLDSTDVVLQSQTDTITVIDLSGLEISDIRDVVYLPNVRYLNLSQNEISDLAPVTGLDSLHHLDVAANNLQNIDILSQACSDSMVVNVAYNYITHFGRMSLPCNCRFTFVGRSTQIDLAAPFLYVYHLYAGFEDGKHYLFYRALSNVETLRVICGSKQVAATADGEDHKVEIPGSLSATTLAYLTDGTLCDSVWVIPAQRLNTPGGQTVSIATGLPDSYRIGYVNTRQGTASADSTMTVTYHTPATAAPDTISFVYYEGHELRGIANYYVNCGVPGDLNGDGIVDIADVNMVINMMIGRMAPTAAGDTNDDGQVDIADVNAVINLMLGKS